MKKGASAKLQLVLLTLAAVFLALALGLRWYASTLPPLEVTVLEPAPEMFRAELVSLRTDYEPRAVLVLCPGYNGDGGKLLRDRKWMEFARKHRLGLVGLSFASDPGGLRGGKGYYYVRDGSGELFFRGLRRIYGKDLPVLLHGFSGGAHFVSRLSEWRSERVIAWSAYSAAWWDDLEPKEHAPPGIVSCGLLDERSEASFDYFRRGRALGRKWLWIGIPEYDHAWNPELDAFVMNYFAAILDGGGEVRARTGDGAAIAGPGQDQPEDSVFLPDAGLLPQWRTLTGKEK